MSKTRSSGARGARGRARAAPRGRGRGSARGPNPRRAAADLCHEVLAAEGVARAEVGVAHGDDRTLRALNRMYRDLDRTTDVLSFTYEDRRDERGLRELYGDVVVSVARVLAQAKRYRVTPGRELARLLVHGSLHLCGHDHMKPGDREVMRARERSHLRELTRVREHALTRLVRAWAAEAK